MLVVNSPVYAAVGRLCLSYAMHVQGAIGKR